MLTFCCLLSEFPPSSFLSVNERLVESCRGVSSRHFVYGTGPDTPDTLCTGQVRAGNRQQKSPFILVLSLPLLIHNKCKKKISAMTNEEEKPLVEGRSHGLVAIAGKLYRVAIYFPPATHRNVRWRAGGPMSGF
jgi:hypothetical protein